MHYTLTLSPSLDYHMRVPTVTPGMLHRTDDTALYPGGKGINVSLMLHTLGLPTCALTVAAGATGELLGTLLTQQGVPHTLIPLTEGQTRLNLKLTTEDCQTEFNAYAPALDPQAYTAIDAHLGQRSRADTVVLSGALPRDTAHDTYARWLDRLHRHAVYTVLDTAGAPLRAALPYAPALIKPNLDELYALLGQHPQEVPQLVRAARTLQQQGAQTVLLSCGAQGAVLVPKEGQALYLPAPCGQVVHTVGSGDCMVAGWLWARAHRRDAAERLRCAVACGSAAAFCAWLPTRDAVDAVLARTASPTVVQE